MTNEIITTLHPDQDPDTNLYPNIKKENIPNGSIDKTKLDENYNTMIDNQFNNLENKIDEQFSYLENKIDNVGDGSPKYIDTSSQITSLTENKGIALATDNGYWYYWDGTQYVIGDVYQAVQTTYNSLDPDLKGKIDLIDVYKNTLYNDISISVIASDYTNGNYQHIFDKKINEGYVVGFQLIIKSYGYITANIQNGNTSSGVSVSTRLVNVGDVVTITGTIQNGNADRLYIYSPNNVVCDVKIIYLNEINNLINDINNLEKVTYNKEYDFNVVSSNYENNSYFYKLSKPLNEGNFVKLKVTAQSYGYLSVNIQNGNVSSGVGIPSTLVNVGDVITITGTIQNGNANQVYVYSPNNVECDIEIYSNVLDLVKEIKSREIIVDINGKGDYISLDDALKYANDSANNPVVIKVKSGVYVCKTETPTDIPYTKNNRYLVIKGEDVNNTIIRNDNGYYSPYTTDSGGLLYDSSPLRLSGNVTIENLTIISTSDNYDQWLNDHPEITGEIGVQSYCIHTDFDCDENTTTLIRNCKMINDHHCCVGGGTRKNHLISIENCELKTTNNTTLLPSLDGATIFIHSYNLNSGNYYEGQKIMLKNNIIVNTNKTKACYFYASNPDRIDATLIGNVSKTTDTQNGFISYGDAYGVYLDDLCYGNNISSMNKVI